MSTSGITDGSADYPPRVTANENSQTSWDAEALEHLNAASSRLWRCSDLAQGLDAILTSTVEATGADLGNLQLFDPERSVLRIAAQHGFKKAFLDYFAHVSTADDSACGRALRTKERIIIADVETEPSFEPMRSVARQAGYRSVQSTPLIGRYGTPLGVLSTHFRVPHTPTQRDLRLLDLYARQACDFIERCRIDQAIKASAERERARVRELEAILDAVPASVWVAHDPECRKVTGNRAAIALLGPSARRNLSFSAPAAERPTAFEIFYQGRKLRISELPIQRAARGEEVRNFEIELRFPEGPSRMLLGNATPLRGSDGQPRGGVAAYVDITDRLQAERQRELLVGELNHRVKNTLATVMALWQHSCAKAENLQAAKESFEARLLALSHTHTRLGEGKWAGASMISLLDGELRPYANREGTNVEICGPDMTLNARAALTMGLAFHELCTNSAKYGAFSTSRGKVTANWTIAGGKMHLEWKESGGPPVTPPVRRGFGRFLIERGIASDFDGDVQLDFDPDGLVCRVTLPLERLLAEQEQQ